MLYTPDTSANTLSTKTSPKKKKNIRNKQFKSACCPPRGLSHISESKFLLSARSVSTFVTYTILQSVSAIFHFSLLHTCCHQHSRRCTTRNILRSASNVARHRSSRAAQVGSGKNACDVYIDDLYSRHDVQSNRRYHLYALPACLGCDLLSEGLYDLQVTGKRNIYSAAFF